MNIPANYHFAGILLASATVTTMILSERVERMGWRTAWASMRWFLLIIISALLIRPASAEFVNGVERFDGTSLDLSTWERYDPAVSTFSQNDALTISGNGSYSDYTTKTVTVGIGQRVTAEVTLNVPPETSTIYAAALLLTTNSARTTNDALHDSRYLGCRMVFGSANSAGDRYFQALSGGSDGFGFAERGQGVPIAGEEFVLGVARLTQRAYEISAARSDGTLIFTFSSSLADPVAPDDLYISLHRTNLRFLLNDSATFDNVIITAIPEPQGVVLTITGIVVCLRRRRHRGGNFTTVGRRQIMGRSTYAATTGFTCNC